GTPFAVLTLHRPANVDDPRVFGDLLGALREIGRHIPIVFPVHPRVTSRLASEATAPGSGRGLICRPPLGYLDFVALMSRARLVLTDSGGIQEETTMLGVPCLTLRDTTERDRKSTRLNSSHVAISYAVFCLKKKKKIINA